MEEERECAGGDGCWRLQCKMNAVEKILENLNLIDGEMIHIFNKIDLVKDKDELSFRKKVHYRDLFVSAEHQFDAKIFLDRLL